MLARGAMGQSLAPSPGFAKPTPHRCGEKFVRRVDSDRDLGQTQLSRDGDPGVVNGDDPIRGCYSIDWRACPATLAHALPQSCRPSPATSRVLAEADRIWTELLNRARFTVNAYVGTNWSAS
jgi:hypothetical protein